MSSVDPANRQEVGDESSPAFTAAHDQFRRRRGVEVIEADGDLAAGAGAFTRVRDGDGGGAARAEVKTIVAGPGTIGGLADDAAAVLDTVGLVEAGGENGAEPGPRRERDLERVEVPPTTAEAQEDVVHAA